MSTQRAKGKGYDVYQQVLNNSQQYSKRMQGKKALQLYIIIFYYSLPAIEAQAQDKKPTRVQKIENRLYGIENITKAENPQLDFVELEQRIGEMQETFQSACGNIQKIIASHMQSDHNVKSQLIKNILAQISRKF